MRRAVFASLLPLLFVAACAEPPAKEMNQARGAIEAARAAGAERFAPTELAAATDALRRSEEAAVQRDYRLSLSEAIDSYERAQAAAKAAVYARAKARGDVERQIAEASTLLGQAQERLRSPDAAALPRRTVQQARAGLEAAEKSLQDARAALNGDDYAAAGKAIEGVSARIQKINATIEESPASSQPRKRR